MVRLAIFNIKSLLILIVALLYTSTYAQEVDCSLVPLEFSNIDFNKSYCNRYIDAQSNFYTAWFESNIAYLYLSHTNIRNPDWSFTGSDFSKSLGRDHIQNDLDNWSAFLNSGDITFFDKDKVHRSDDKKKFYYRIFNTDNLSGLKFTTNLNNKNDMGGYFFLFNDKEINDQTAILILDAIFLKKLRKNTKSFSNNIFEGIDTSNQEIILNSQQDNSNSNIVDTDDLETFTEYCESTPLGDIDPKLIPLCLKLKTD